MAATNHQPKDVSTDDAQPADLEKRDIRALTEPMTTMTNVDDIEPPEYEVTSSSGSAYIVDIDAGTCTCPDHQHRGVDCAHIRRARYETGRSAIPGWVDASMLDDQLGAHIDETPRIAMADGGVQALEATQDDGRDLGTEPVDGGLLVFDDGIDKPGRKLVGFADVDDWDAIRDTLTRRGHGVGAIHHLETFDAEEVSA